jgi:hypothetical protein
MKNDGIYFGDWICATATDEKIKLNQNKSHKLMNDDIDRWQTWSMKNINPNVAVVADKI